MRIQNVIVIWEKTILFFSSDKKEKTFGSAPKPELIGQLFLADPSPFLLEKSKNLTQLIWLNFKVFLKMGEVMQYIWVQNQLHEG